MLRPIAIATAISGTLDILFAMILTVAFGRHIGDMLRSVASGPFPTATGTNPMARTANNAIAVTGAVANVADALNIYACDVEWFYKGTTV